VEGKKVEGVGLFPVVSLRLCGLAVKQKRFLSRVTNVRLPVREQGLQLEASGLQPPFG
jgi:hypothetical protein